MIPQWGNENIRLYNEMINKNYGGVSRSPEELKALYKTDAPVLSSTTGFWNTVYGASVLQQLNTSSSLFNLLPKFPYQRGGYRAQTTRFKDSGIGVAENAAIPDSVKPTQAAVAVPIKEHALVIEYSERMRLLANTKDDVGFDVAATLERAKQSFAYAIDADLNTDVTTLASSNIESIDRVVSSYAEVTNCSDLTAGDADIYTMDRDAAATWYDAYVSHNSGTARELTDGIVRDLISNSVSAGANPSTQVWYSGVDTYNKLLSLYESQIRYASAAFTPKTNVNSGEAGGINYGQEMATLYGRPVFVNPTSKVATNGTIANLYLLDVGHDPVYGEPYLGIKVLQAPIVAETRMVNYPAHAKLGNEDIIYAAMELECKRFNIQAKARDLK